MATTDDSFSIQELPHLTRPIGFTSLLVQHAHPLDEGVIRLCPCTRLALPPGIEATAARLQRATHARQPKLVVMGLHERVLHRDSLAKYAAAFFKISRSSVTWANSRFSRLISVVRSFRAPEPGNALLP